MAAAHGLLIEYFPHPESCVSAYTRYKPIYKFVKYGNLIVAHHVSRILGSYREHTTLVRHGFVS